MRLRLKRAQARWFGDIGLAAGGAGVAAEGSTALIRPPARPPEGRPAPPWGAANEVSWGLHLPTAPNCTRGSTATYSRSDTSLTTRPISVNRYSEPSTTG